MSRVVTRKITKEDLEKLQQWEEEGKLKIPQGLKEKEEETMKNLMKMAEEAEREKEVEVVEVGKKAVEEKAEQPRAKKEKKTEKTKAEKKKPKAKKGKPKDEKKVVNMEGTLTTRDVAAMVGTTPKALRRVLRAKWYNDGVHTNYRWTQDDPILKEILKYYEGQKEASKN